MEITLAEALLRRKELQEKVDQLRQINEKELYEIKAKRVNVTENVDDLVAQVPKISINQVTAAYDYHAKHQRKIDAVIQQANWNTKVEVDEQTMNDYVEIIDLTKQEDRK